MVTVLEMDSQRITGGEGGLVVVGAVIPQVEITLVMPSQTPGKESSGADLESVIPDSSSIADDIVTNPSIQWNTVLSTNLQVNLIHNSKCCMMRPHVSYLVDCTIHLMCSIFVSKRMCVFQDGGVYKRENAAGGSPPSDHAPYPVVSPNKLESPKALNTLMGLSSVKKGLSNLSSLFDGGPFKGDDVSDSGSVRYVQLIEIIISQF